MADVLDTITTQINEQFPESDDGSTPEPVETPSEPVAGAEPVEPTEAAKPAEPDEIDKILEADGIKSSAERENRIPYKRVKKIIENALKKEKELAGKTLGEHTTKLTAAEQELERYKVADMAAKTDPDRYMQILSVINPAFAAYKKAQQEAAKEAAKPSFEKPRPVPDTQFTDGSVGYSPEQHEKLLDWVAEKAAFEAESRAVATLEAKYGKTVQQIETDRRQAEQFQQDLTSVRRRQQHYHEIYGDLVDTHQDEITKMLIANNGQDGKPYLEADLVVAKVLAPKMAADRSKIREEVMGEMNDRSKAATKAVPAQAKAAIDPEERRDTYDVIDEVLRAQGL